MWKWEGQGGEEEWKKIVSSDMGRYEVMKERKLGAVSRTVSGVLPKRSKVQWTLIARVDLVLARYTAVKAIRLRW